MNWLEKIYVKLKMITKIAVFSMGCFLHLKKYCLTPDEYGVIEEHKTFEGLTGSQRLLDRNQYLEMLKSSKIHAKLPLSWKKRL